MCVLKRFGIFFDEKTIKLLDVLRTEKYYADMAGNAFLMVFTSLFGRYTSRKCFPRRM